MDRLEKFDYLMGILDGWAEKTPDRNGVSFKNLREETWVREFIVTTNFRISMATIKNFFVIEVLRLYPKNTPSKVSWQDMRRCLGKEAKKKYQFDFSVLDKYFSFEENRKAAEKTQLLKGYDKIAENPESWREIPLCLLNRIQEVFREKLGDYWHICEHVSDKMDLRREKYKEILIALSLHEIFVREFSKNWDILMKEFKQRKAVFHEALDELTEIGNILDKADKYEKTLMKQVEKQSQKIEEFKRWIERFWIIQLTCLEHNIGLEAEIQLVMLLEIKRLDSISEYDGKNLESKIEKYLNFTEGKWLDDYVNYNRNKLKYYQRLESVVQDVFVRYMEKNSLCENEVISYAIKKYVRIVERGEPDDEKREELWDAQCIMVRPMIMKKSDVR